MSKRHFFVEGRVQGVGYRAYARAWADRLGVSGWVRNRADGTVEVFASGAENDLEAFLTRLRQGPAHGEVSDLRFNEPDDAAKTEAGFRILPTA